MDVGCWVQVSSVIAISFNMMSRLGLNVNRSAGNMSDTRVRYNHASTDANWNHASSFLACCRMAVGDYSQSDVKLSLAHRDSQLCNKKSTNVMDVPMSEQIHLLEMLPEPLCLTLKRRLVKKQKVKVADSCSAGFVHQTMMPFADSLKDPEKRPLDAEPQVTEEQLKWVGQQYIVLQLFKFVYCCCSFIFKGTMCEERL